MNTNQLPVDIPDVLGAIYGVALSLDSFLVNGIQYELLQRVASNGFLQKTASNLLRDLASLEEHAPHAPLASQPKVREVLAALRNKCQELIELVTGLSAFRTLSLEQLHAAVSQIPVLREECVQLIQELEGGFRTKQPFYPSRPSHSTSTVNEFLTDLERLFAEEWNASGEQRGRGTLANREDDPRAQRAS